MSTDSLIEKLRAIKPSSISPELSEHAYAQAVEDCIAIIMEESAESETVTACNGHTESDGPRSLPSPSSTNTSEIRALTEDEFVKIWANKTWASSTFKFLEREGLQIMKATKPVSASRMDAAEEFSKAILEAYAKWQSSYQGVGHVD